MISITDAIRNFTAAVQKYLHINDEYRRAGVRNPLRRQELKEVRAAAFHNAETCNAALAQHLANYPEPDPIRTHARELIERWEFRNTQFEALRNRRDDDHPREAINRLNKAEKLLKDQLEIITKILKIH